MGERPNGFARFELEKDGKLGVLHLTFDDRQAYELQRERAGDARWLEVK